jgi:hypothetical protein
VFVVFEGAARAQEPDVPATKPADVGSAQALSLRYRFTEKYAQVNPDDQPGLLVQYQVGSIETYRIETEKPQGAPDRVEETYHTIYTERPAKIGRQGEVTDAVRRYDSFRVRSARPSDARKAALFRDLTLWYQLRGRAVPLLISLMPNRSIRQEEYNSVVNQLFLPRLLAVLPPRARPVRVDDTWPISRQDAQALLGRLPEAGDFNLEGHLLRVEKTAGGTTLTATIDISGELALDQGEGEVRARISFVFEPPPPPAAAEPKEATDRPGGARPARDAGIVEATGYIAKVQMSRRQTVPIDEEGRLQEVRTRELVLQRRLGTGQAGGAAAAPVLFPEKAPTPDETNSWLVFDDPQGRFHFLHPQELSVDVHQPDRIEMTYARPGGGLDVLILLPIARQRDPLRERQLRDPQEFVRELKDVWLRNGHEVVMGEVGFLPDADWAPRKRRVYRVEAAVKPKQDALGGRNVARFYLDAYLVLFERNECIRLEALTDRENHVVLRDQAEGLIRSLELGPSTPGAAGASAQPQPTQPSATPSPPGRPEPPPVPPSGERP